MLEKRFIAVSPQNFLSNGTTDGKFTIADTTLFKVKQQVIIVSNTRPPLELEVKRINSETEIEVGPKGHINDRTNISLYLVAEGANIKANEQNRPSIPMEEIVRAVYEEEPTVAIRTMNVGPDGEYAGFNSETHDGIVPKEFDDVQLTRVDGDVTRAMFYKNSVLLDDIEILYDSNGDVIRARRTGP